MKTTGLIGLFRPLVLPTALGDAFLGAGTAMVALGAVVTWEKLATACALSLLLYGFGVVLNDLADERADRAAGADRPLATGAVGRKTALAASTVTAALAVLILSRLPAAAAWAAGICAAFIVLYNFTHKKLRALSPFLMGGARSADVLAAGAVFGLDVGSALSNPVVFCFALSYGLYVTAVTFVSLMEEEPGDRSPLLFSWIAVLVGCFVLYPVLRYDVLSWYFYLHVMVSAAFLATSVYVVFSPERRARLRWYMPMWITPLCLLGGMGLYLLSSADIPERFLLPGAGLAALYPVLTALMYWRMSRAAEKGGQR